MQNAEETKAVSAGALKKQTTNSARFKEKVFVGNKIVPNMWSGAWGTTGSSAGSDGIGAGERKEQTSSGKQEKQEFWGWLLSYSSDCDWI